MKRLVPVFVLLALCLSTLPVHLSAQEAEEPVVESTASSNALMDKLRGSGKTGVALFVISIVGFSFAFERVFNLR